MKSFIILPLFFMLFIVSPSYTLIKKFTVQMESRTIDVRISYKAGMEKWADYFIGVTKNYLPAVEKYFGQGIPIPKSFTIYGEDKTYYQGKRVGGKNDGKDVFVEYGITQIGNPSLLFHEINHFLFPIPPGDEWCIEGAVSFLPAAMLETGYLDPADVTYKSIYVHWGLHQLLPENAPDLPVYPDFRNYDVKGESFDTGCFYTKTFKVQYLINKELGAKSYREFLLILMNRSMSAGDLKFIPAALNSLKEKDWKGFLSGWVYKGKYPALSLQSFSDGDRDGLIDIDEIYGNTDYKNPDTDGDMIPDGAEIALGIDPLKADTPDTVKKYAPFTDGLPYEWSSITALKNYDAVGDGDKKAGFDFTEMQYTFRENYLFVCVLNQYHFTPQKNYMFDILIDTDFDGKSDYEQAFMLPSPAAHWIYRDGVKNSFNPTNSQCSWNTFKQADGETGTCFEMKIPLDEIGSPKALQILPIIRNMDTAKNFDEWGGWIEILKFDANTPFGDIVKKYGIIIDGIDSEWAGIDSAEYVDKDILKVSEGAFDLDSVKLYQSGDNLYVVAKTMNDAFPKREVFFTVRIDTDGDGHTDMEASTGLKSPGYPFVYFYSIENWKTIPGQKSAWHDCIEMLIPCKELKLPKKFKISPMFWDNEKKKTLDEWSGWIDIQLN
ncbi:MAG: hypothetical protein HPY53_14980 [Brevinematales bacterium]|nr:hypothetical protein [Brevinematales bacterium]